MSFLDDGPSITADGETPSLVVDETLITTDTDSADFAGVFSSVPGADGATLSYSLGIAGANGLDSGLDDSATGDDIVLVLNGNVVEGHVGTTGGALAFTITLTGSTVTLDQMSAVIHGSADVGDDANEGVSLDRIANLVTLTATITDADGDTDSAFIDLGKQVSFLDDGPSINSIQDARVANDSDPIVGNINVDFGADGFSGAGHGLKVLSVAEVSGIVAEISTDGKTVTGYLDTNSNGVRDTGEDTEFYKLTLDDATSTYTFEHAERQITPLPLDFEAASGGPDAETLAVPTVESETGDEYVVTFDGVVLVGATLTHYPTGDPNDELDDVKPTGTGFGIGEGNQTSIQSGEGFITTFQRNGAESTLETFSFVAAAQGVQGGNSGDFQVHWRALIGGQEVDSDVITFSGVGTQDNNLVLIDPSDSFDELEVWFTDLVNINNLRIENFSIGVSQFPEDVPLQFEIAAVDGDGDVSASGLLDITIEGEEASDLTLQGTDQTQGDVLAGGESNEVLVAGGGDDILIGGGGSDMLTGGTGGDTFKWNATDGDTTTPPVDTVTDFDTVDGAAGGDKLDLSELLQSEPDSDGGDLTAYLSVMWDEDAGKTTITVKSDGVTVDQTIEVGVNLTTGFNQATQQAEIIQNLLDQTKLISE